MNLIFGVERDRENNRSKMNRFAGAVHLGLQGGQQVCRTFEAVGGGDGRCKAEAAHDGVPGDQWQNA